MTNLNENLFGYTINPKYKKSVAYFSMEFAIDQSLKIYSGGLGFLAGSHMRSSYQLKQNLVGVGILWTYGYYDQVRSISGSMKAEFTHKYNSFLHDPKILVPITIHGAEVWVKAMLLKPETFGSAPIFLLTTDIPENDGLSRTITRKLYDSNESTRLAQSMVLGIGGAKVLESAGLDIDYYHMNEGHALPLCFHLYQKFGKSKLKVKEHLVFTTHTPEKAGNEEHHIDLMDKMSFFCGLDKAEVRDLVGVEGDMVNYTLSALRLAKKANAVSKMHGDVSRDMWSSFDHICEITHITNSQNKLYWSDSQLDAAFKKNNHESILERKQAMKKELFKVVADQTGKLFDPNILTLVWARRFAGYKRADLLMHHFDKFLSLIKNTDLPIQIIWAGKPYPEDFGAIDTFNNIWWKTLEFKNCAVLTGYELGLSALLKKGSDIWLNNPKITREASGTSGMTAAMNGSINFSIPDGWIPEFAIHGENCFLIEPATNATDESEQNAIEAERMIEILNTEILPTYYHHPEKWAALMTKSANDVVPFFDSDRMADEYYKVMFQ